MESNNNGSFGSDNDKENQLSFSSSNQIISTSSANYINRLNSPSLNLINSHNVNTGLNSVSTLSTNDLPNTCSIYNGHCTVVNEDKAKTDSLINTELLPLCDLLFNIISLAAYFCDIVFDSVTIYTFYLDKNFFWFSLALAFVSSSAIISHTLSLKWYTEKVIKIESTFDLHKPQNLIIVFVHIFQFGILWRYFKLFIPVDLSVVKHEVRDLCMVRMVHAFGEAAPMLLIQVSYEQFHDYHSYQNQPILLFVGFRFIFCFLSLRPIRSLI